MNRRSLARLENYPLTRKNSRDDLHIQRPHQANSLKVMLQRSMVIFQLMMMPSSYLCPTEKLLASLSAGGIITSLSWQIIHPA
jgi:hypothetical protein